MTSIDDQPRDNLGQFGKKSQKLQSFADVRALLKGERTARAERRTKA